MRWKRSLVTLLAWVTAYGCTGHIGETGSHGRGSGGTATGTGTGGSGNPGKLEDYLGVGASGFRRLTRVEYDNTLRDLLGDATRSGFAKLPEDVTDPFDNDYKTQQVSGTLIDAAETLAAEASARALADPTRRAT